MAAARPAGKPEVGMEKKDGTPTIRFTITAS
jgi:hypothetical protein